jgi:CheY-like chemotaxis protein
MRWGQTKSIIRSSGFAVSIFDNDAANQHKLPAQQLSQSTVQKCLVGAYLWYFFIALVNSNNLSRSTNTMTFNIIEDSVNWMYAPLDSSIKVSTMWLVHFSAIIGFSCVSFLGITTMVYTVNPLKRHVATIMLPVNTLALLTYVLVQTGATTYLISPLGVPVLTLRYVQWSVTSPLLVLSNFVMSGSGWTARATVYMIMQHVCIMSGLLASLYLGSEDWVRHYIGWVSIVISFVTWIFVLAENHIRLAPHPDALPTERVLWSGLQFFSTLVWTLFPAVWLLQYGGLISHLMAECMYTLCDFTAKMVYSTVHASQSFLSIDLRSVFQTLEDPNQTDEFNDVQEVQTRIRAARHVFSSAMVSHSSTSSYRIFLKSITHELRTPLTTIIAHNTSLLDTGAVSQHPQQEKTVIESLSMAEALLCEIDMAMEYSAYEREGFIIKPTMQPTNIVDVMDNILESNIHRALTKNLDMRVRHKHGDSVIEADPRHLQDIFTVLIDNALKFAHSNSRVDVDVSIDLEQKELIFFVGNGRSELIDPQKASHMFKPFFICMMDHQQGNYSGMGLGLALAEAKVRALNGYIDIRSCNPDPIRITQTIASMGSSGANPMGNSSDSVPQPAQALNVVVHIPLSQSDRLRFSADRRITGMNLRTTNSNKYAVIVSRDLKEDIVCFTIPLACRRNGYNLYEDGCVGNEKIVVMIEASVASARSRYPEVMMWAAKRGRQVSIVAVKSATIDIPGKRSTVNDGTSIDSILVAPTPVRVMCRELGTALSLASRRPIQASLVANSPTPIPENSNPLFHVLLVDDNKMNLTVIGMILRKLGCAVVVAENGTQAVSTVKDGLQSQKPFQIIFMDLRMPVMDGFEAITQIRRLENHLGKTIRHVIVGMANNISAEDRTRMVNCGCEEFLTKPVRANLVQDMLEKCHNILQS